MIKNLETTPIYDAYWRFAAERQSVYFRRLCNSRLPWTDDPIIANYRFTNAYRAADRVSQYLINEVQYRKDRSQAVDEVFFRTILFKVFNKIDTWEAIEDKVGRVSWQAWDRSAVDSLLTELRSASKRIYSAAYIMPSPNFGYQSKHSNHLGLLEKMMSDRLPSRLSNADSLKDVYEAVLSYPGIGPFLAFQYTVDLNYSSLVSFDEDDFIVAGPGALDGISKCFVSTGNMESSQIIEMMVDRQEEEFERLGIEFHSLFGRRLHLIDCQNLFCEISKYSRVSHPKIIGVNGRTRIKQHYKCTDGKSNRPFFPPKWKLNTEVINPVKMVKPKGQLALFS